MFRVICATTVLLCAALLPAQGNLSGLVGTVLDPHGARVPGALITVTDRATGLVRKTETTVQGLYSLPDLPIGTYTVEIAKSGFALARFNSVGQSVGATRTLDVHLQLAENQAQTTVTEALVQFDKSGGTVGSGAERAQVDNLPLNGRNWANLTAFTPGAIDNGAGDQRTIRFAGHGLDDNNLTLDGVDATAIYNQEQREYMRLNIPVDSISAFQVQAQNFGADVEGGTAGGQVAVATPSGTNAFSGELFDYFRNNALDARSPFDGPSPAPFLLNQFGANFGGPVVTDKTFFFVAYEGLRQRLDQRQIGLVPSPAFLARAQRTSPALAAILNAYPAGTSPTANVNVWNYNAPGRQIDNEDSGMVRLDQHFTDRLTGFLRFNSDEAVQTAPTGALTALNKFDTKFNNGVVQLSQVITPTLVNEVKFGLNQTIYHTAKVSPVDFGVAVSGSTGGFSALTGSSTTDYPSKSFDLLDDLAWTRGKHSIKVGGEIRWLVMNQGTSQSGTVTFNSLNSFMNDQLGSASYTALLPLKRQRKTQYWGYVQDEWRPTLNFTLTAGVRYNYFNVFHEIQNRDIPFDFGTCGGYCPVTDSFSHPRSNDFDPRIGLAWSHRSTVLRAGGGIYHTDGQEDDQNLPISNDVARYAFSSTSLPNLSYPLTPFILNAEANNAGVLSPRDLDRNRKDEYVAAWTASVQQELPSKLLGTVTYLGNKGTDILTTTYVNLADPATRQVPYPAFGPISWRGNVGNSTFHALQGNVRRQFQNGWLLVANYMWSHSINDGSIGGGESDTPQNSFCRSCDKASSDDDIRHVFNASAVYRIPFTGAHFRRLLNGWELSGIQTWQTGLPVNVTIDRSNSVVPGLYSIAGFERPNLVLGAPLTPGDQTASAFINRLAFSTPAPGTFGNLGRNILRASGLSQLDLGLSKYVAFTERTSVRFRADLFNVANRAQFGAPNADLSLGNFGTITTVANVNATGRGTPRELQLSAKFLF